MTHLIALASHAFNKLPIQTRILALSAVPLIGLLVLGGQIVAEKNRKTLGGELSRVEEAIGLATAIEDLWSAFDEEKVRSNILRPKNQYATTQVEGDERARQLREYREAQIPTDQEIANVQAKLNAMEQATYCPQIQEALDAIVEDLQREIPRIRARWEASSSDFQEAYLASESVMARFMEFAPLIVNETSDVRLAKKLLAYGNYLQIAAAHQKSFRLYDWGHDIGQLPPHAAIIAEQVIFRRKHLEKQMERFLEPERLATIRELKRSAPFVQCATMEEEWRTKDLQPLYTFQPAVRPEWQKWGQQRFKDAEATVALLRNDILEYKDRYIAASKRERNNAFFSLAASVVGILLMSFALARSIAATTAGTVLTLSQGAGEIHEAADSVSKSAMALSQAADAQESRINSSSSSINSLTRSAEENHRKAESASAAINQAAKTMRSSTAYLDRLNDAMHEIADNSVRTQQIIKTIDEISFQTNILALNAAVEAARAGESGAGFAVVADEVRALAQRAAKAANDTTRLISESRQTVDHGKQICEQANVAFEQVASETEKVIAIVSEIDQATQSQRSDFEQLLVASNELHLIAEQNASTAQQNATAAERLNTQSESMNLHIRELEKLIGGKTPQRKPKRSNNGQTPRHPRNERSLHPATTREGHEDPWGISRS